MAVTLVFSKDLTLLPTSPSAPARIAPVSVIRAGEWFLHSGIQEPAGGVARYHYISERRNARISTEITGYAVSALLEVHERTGDERFLEAATRAGDLLVRAWDPAAEAMPFEWAADGVLPEHHSYFFDNGIIIRGLIRLWRATSNQTYLDTAVKELGGRKFLVHHIVNPRNLEDRLASRVTRERPEVVVFGHTHKQFCEAIGRTLYFNPGYAGQSRFGMSRSVAILHCDAGEIRPEYLPL